MKVKNISDPPKAMCTLVHYETQQGLLLLPAMARNVQNNCMDSQVVVKAQNGMKISEKYITDQVYWFSNMHTHTPIYVHMHAQSVWAPTLGSSCVQPVWGNSGEQEKQNIRNVQGPFHLYKALETGKPNNIFKDLHKVAKTKTHWRISVNWDL